MLYKDAINQLNQQGTPLNNGFPNEKPQLKARPGADHLYEAIGPKEAREVPRSVNPMYESYDNNKNQKLTESMKSRVRQMKGYESQIPQNNEAPSSPKMKK